MAYETVMGLQVGDAKTYDEYRASMKPILKKYGGGFRYDFWVKETLLSETEYPINRVFILYFADKSSRDKFFADPEYIEVRKKYFNPSVSSITTIAAYERKA